MKHEMKLNNGPFMNFKLGTKTIEMRLNDEKRRLVKVGDIIEFTNRDNGEKFEAKVIEIYPFSSFDELYNYFDKKVLGYNDDEYADPNDMSQYYSKEDIEKYGVLGIEVTLL